MVHRARIGILLLPLLGALPSCRVAKTRGASDEGHKHLENKDYVRAGSAFETAAALARDPKDKAKALLGAGHAALSGGDAKKALQLFYDARMEGAPEPIASDVNRAIGEAYFALEEYGLAGRYLAKGLDRVTAESREETLARLVVCSRARADAAAAALYRGRLAEPASPEVERILAVEPRTVPVAVHALDEDRAAEADESFWRTQRPPAAERPENPGAEGGRLVVHPRDSWNARAPRRNIDPMGRVDKITIHHSGDDSYHGVSAVDAAGEIQRIQRYHQNEQGWADIGYHYIVDRGGTVWQGRRLRYQGAHARGAANAGNIGIVVLGNYFQQGMTAAQVRSLETLVTKLCSHFGITPGQVYTHREIVGGKTECPGPALARCVREIRDRLRQRLVAYRP
jgi:tetratricopeptide (TPR) repeat protein